jgi:hypothetical protein
MTYYDMGNPQSSLEWYEKAIKIQYDILGKKHSVLEKTINNAALAYSKVKKDNPSKYPFSFEDTQKKA